MEIRWIVFQIIIVCNVLESWSHQAFFERKKGDYLAKTVMQRKLARSELECSGFCLRVNGCLSVNYQHSKKHKSACELNNGTIENSPRNILKMPDYTYLGIINQEVEEEPKNLQGLYLSTILKQNKQFVNQLTKWLDNQKSWELCYRASEHEWSAKAFHTHCDDKGPTVTIIRVGNYIFGGYSDASWGGAGYIKGCGFLFSLRNKDSTLPFKSPLPSDCSNHATSSWENTGPIFGEGHDLIIEDKAGSRKSSYSNLGYTYKLPARYTYTYGTDKAKALLGGTQYFTPNEMEIFYLKK